jgi:hypothetical protein
LGITGIIKANAYYITMDSQQLYNIGKFVIVVMLIVAIGMIILNQLFSWYYHAELLVKPCDLCKQLNPDPIKEVNLSIDYFKPTSP